MKLSRKILGVATGIGVLGASSISMAASENIAMEQLLPANIDAVYTLDTTVKNPFEVQLKDLIKQSMTAENTSSESDMALIDVILDNNRLVYGMDMPNEIESEEGILKDPEMYMGVRVTEEGFFSLYEKAKSEMTITEETYNGVTLYVGDNDTVVVHIGGLFIMTSNKENAMEVVDRYKGTKNDALANYSNYMDIMTHANDAAFFSMYVNPAEMGDQIGDALAELGDVFPQFANFNKDVISSMEGEGVWVSQNSTGFTMNIAIEGDDAQLKELNMSFDKHNFVPKLWEKISGTGLMMYGEVNLTDSWMTDAVLLYGDMFADEDYIAWKNEFKADSNIDFDKEILSLMKNQQMFTVHKTDRLIPAVTWMVDVASNKYANAATVEKLNEYLKKIMAPVETEAGVDFFNSEIVDMNGSKFYKNTFNFGTVLRAEGDSIMDLVGDDQVTITLYMTTTIDGTMVISTLPSLGNMLNHSLKDNSTFEAAFPILNQPVAEIGYFDVKTLNDYVTMAMQDLGAPEDAVTGYNDFMAPFKDISWMSFADSDTVWATMNMNVDVEGLAKTFETAAEWFKEQGQYYDYEIPESPFAPTANFCDVYYTDWFWIYVSDLSGMEVVKGYEDGCFHPERDVTRAEFTKMALKASELAGNYYAYDSQQFEDRFTDIDYSNDWFAPIVDQAAANNLVKGFDDKTFRPNASIARAEAVQILFNMSSKMKSVDATYSEYSFLDVKPSDWFFGAVRAARYYNLVSGVTPITFEPTRNLTRAEATKIISGFYHLESDAE